MNCWHCAISRCRRLTALASIELRCSMPRSELSSTMSTPTRPMATTTPSGGVGTTMGSFIRCMKLTSWWRRLIEVKHEQRKRVTMMTVIEKLKKGE